MILLVIVLSFIMFKNKLCKFLNEMKIKLKKQNDTLTTMGFLLFLLTYILLILIRQTRKQERRIKRKVAQSFHSHRILLVFFFLNFLFRSISNFYYWHFRGDIFSN